MRMRWPSQRTLPSSTQSTCNSAAISPMDFFVALYWTAEVRAITPSRLGLSCPRCEIISSVSPSTKYSRSQSPHKFSKGKDEEHFLGCRSGLPGLNHRSNETISKPGESFDETGTPRGVSQ